MSAARGVTLFAATLAISASCGYSVGAVRTPGNVRRISVAPVQEDGIDIDAAALVAREVRRKIANGMSTTLSDEENAQAVLAVTLLDSDAKLAPLADPGLRAAQYVAVVRIRGTLTSTAGKALWKSGVISAEAPYLSVPDDLEALDGARRRALAQAAESAAARLVGGMTYGH
jgi:hypothetical protein